ncbi:hypothetical protein [Halospeciosus flavus]|uniref:Uncharacterized protein n=1 Tax=Halospeciosus flavus TaxID=3032283 RepID=A0ABD5Z072_9EURY
MPPTVKRRSERYENIEGGDSELFNGRPSLTATKNFEDRIHETTGLNYCSKGKEVDTESLISMPENSHIIRDSVNQ